MDERVRLSPERLLRWTGDMVEYLLEMAEEQPIRVFYVPRGGFVPAYLLVTGLRLKSGGGVEPPSPVPDDTRCDDGVFTVVVDDVVDTGAILERVVNLFCDAGDRWAFVAPVVKGNKVESRGLVLCGAEARFRADVWVVFPWEDNWPEEGKA